LLTEPIRFANAIFIYVSASSGRFSLAKSDKPGEEICSAEALISGFLARTWQFGVSKRQYRNSFQLASMRGCDEADEGSISIRKLLEFSRLARLLCTIVTGHPTPVNGTVT
jgi:hypothetical protein